VISPNFIVHFVPSRMKIKKGRIGFFRQSPLWCSPRNCFSTTAFEVIYTLNHRICAQRLKQND
jgi:hypothetical protein